MWGYYEQGENNRAPAKTIAALALDQTVPASPDPQRRPPPRAFDDALQKCVVRLASWLQPPNWSRTDWLEELRQLAAVAAWQAQSDHPNSPHILLEAFIYQRVMSDVRTHYRREWTFGTRCTSESSNNFPPHETARHSAPLSPIHEQPNDYTDLHEAISALPEIERRIIEGHFFDGRTETQLARALGVAQSTTNTHKHSALSHLRQRLSTTESLTLSR